MLDQLKPRLPVAGTLCRTPIIERIAYLPYRKDSTDLEAATKTISATAEASGLPSADYNAALTINQPADARLAVLSIAARLSVTIDSDDGAHDLRCRVYVDLQDADHLICDLTCTTTGNQLSAQSMTAAVKPILFALLNNGAAHTFYFYFWSPGNHSPVISVVQLWEAVGTNLCVGCGTPIIAFTPLTHCEVQLRLYHLKCGAGTNVLGFFLGGDTGTGYGNFALHETGLIQESSSGITGCTQMLPAAWPLSLNFTGSLTTDIHHIFGMSLIVKRWE